MPSKTSQFLLDIMRKNRQLFTKSKTVGAVMEIEPDPRVIEKLQTYNTSAQLIEELGMPAVFIKPKKEKHPLKVILHLHGGAYVSGGLLQSHAVLAPICDQSGFRGMTFAYRLAPKSPFPAQLEDALKAYDYLINLGYDEKNIALVGESAGGHLALSLVQKLKMQNRPLPCALCLLSPWTDLMQLGESYQDNKLVDATLDPVTLKQSAFDFIGNDETLLNNPLISPLIADYHGFPPTQIHCGTSELLRSDSRQLRDKMLNDGLDVQLIEWEGMCHVFQIFKFEESRLSIKMIGEFLSEKLLKK